MTTRITDKNITSTGVAAGTYTNATVAVNAQGQITSASNGAGFSGLQHTTYTYIANGSTTTFAASSGITVHTVLAIIDGVTQTPTTDYTVSGSNVIFTSPPPADSQVQLRILGDIAIIVPKITAITVTDSNYAAIDDTAVDISGGYIKLTGTGFVSGCLVYFNQTPAASVSFISGTELRVGTGALAAGTYVVYVINSDGGAAISVPGINFSGLPSWQTASALSEQTDGVAISLSLLATDATSYTLTSGSLPPGLSLNTSTGAITGTVTGITVDTIYTFTVRATDAQNQDSPRTFTITITVSDAYFRLTTLLLNGDSGNTVVTDSSTNNFNLTVFGDTRASNFTPYSTGWGAYLNGSTSAGINIAGTSGLLGTSVSYTFEGWFQFFANNVTDNHWLWGAGSYPNRWSIDVNVTLPNIQVRVVTENNAVLWSGNQVSYTAGTWVHIAVVNNVTNNTLTVFINGTAAGSTTAVSLGAYSTHKIGTQASNVVLASSLRFVNGQALYTGTFTPSTNPLTTTTVGTTGANVAASLTGTVGYLVFNSNRFIDLTGKTVTTSGTPQIVSANPFGITNTGTNGSAYFDGTGDYLTLSPGTAFAFSTGNFTVELFAYITVSAANYYLIDARNSSQTTNWFLNIGGSNNWQWYNTSVVLAGGTPVLNQWNHIVYVRSGTTGSLFVNGSRVATQTDSYDYSTSPTTAYIASRYNAAEQLTGYISNLRVVKGTAVYDPTQTTITVPTTPVTTIANTQLLTLQYKQPHNNHTFQDASSNQFLITRNGNTTQGTFSPFSQTGWSNYFDGTGDYLTIPDNAAFDLASGDFLIEAFVYCQSSTNFKMIMGQWNTGQVSYTLRQNASKWVFTYTTNGSTEVAVNGTSNQVLNAWTHLAVIRTGNTLGLFVNGTRETTASMTGITIHNNTGVFSVGAAGNGGDGWLGYIGPSRLVKTTLPSGYDATLTTCPVPTAPFSSTATTSVIVCQSNRFVDLSTNNFTITRNGDTSVVAFSPFNPTAVWSAAVNGGSGYFDGTGDYLTANDNAALELGSSNFCIEFLYYPTSSANTDFVTKRVNASSYGLIIVQTGLALQFWLSSSGSSWDLFSNQALGSITLNAWNHLAIYRIGNAWYSSLNGTITTLSASLSGAVNNNAANWNIGGNNYAAGSIIGYLSNFRLVIGSSVYTSTSAPIPTAPLTAITNTSLLLNFTDAAILDSTGRNVLETVADAKTSSVQLKYGTGSMYFDGTGDVIAIPDSRLLDFGSSDWTIEFWIYRTVNAQHVILTKRTSNVPAGMPVIYANTSNKIIVEFSSQTTFTPTNTVSLNTWTHVAIVRSGSGSGNVKQYINGTVDPTTVTWTTLTTNSSPMYIGGDSNGNNFTGYIDDLRITQFARYTANFTPPTASHRLK